MSDQFFGIEQQQKQEQTLTPQQRQSLEVLAAPLMELQARLNQEAQLNPMLEVEGPALEYSVGDPLSNAIAAEDRAAAADMDPEDREMEELSAGMDGWLDALPLSDSDSGEAQDRSRRRDFALNSLTVSGNRQDYLLEQLRFADVPEKLFRAAVEVIGNLDERGFLLATDKEIASGAGCDERTAARAVKLVQSFEPPGIAARTLEESFLIQLKAKGVTDRILLDIVSRHMDLLARNQIPQLARNYRIGVDELKSKLSVLKELNMRPGSSLDNSPELTVAPEFIVKRHGRELLIVDNPGVLPRLRISSDYDEILRNSGTPPEAKKFLNEKRTAAEQLIRALTQRETTLRRITELLVSMQYDFFFKGPKALKPLTMLQLAEKLDLHETTVSRAVAGKYLGTPFGVVEYRSFFSGGYVSREGEEIASGGVKEKIREVIAGEDRRKPLSDEKIAKLLKESGLAVARRTVAKYREELGILPTHLRKEF